MRAAVLGSPIRHSLSPALHNAAYAELGLHDWNYQARECGEDELAGVLDGLDADWAGLSLTMPLKRVALELATSASALAVATGAANTLVLRDGRRYADNTDVAGIVAALRGIGAGGGPAARGGQVAAANAARADGTAGIRAAEAGRRAVVLGAGGTAQASLAALAELGVAEPTVLVRSLSRTTDLRAAAERLGVAPTVVAALTDPGAVAAHLAAADIVISTLPAGPADPFTGITAGTAVLDVVYAPWPTRFAAHAEAAGARVVSGLEMLLHQAAAQVELMTGRTAPVAAMRDALDVAVAARV